MEPGQILLVFMWVTRIGVGNLSPLLNRPLVNCLRFIRLRVLMMGLKQSSAWRHRAGLVLCTLTANGGHSTRLAGSMSTQMRTRATTLVIGGPLISGGPT